MNPILKNNMSLKEYHLQLFQIDHHFISIVIYF